MTEEVLKWIRKENLIQAGDDVLVGISGGADSVCLLLVLLALRETLDISLRAVHVEHGIRGEESLADAAYVQELCKRWKVPCRVCSLNVPQFAKEQGVGTEEAARSLRYDCYRREAEQIAAERENCRRQQSTQQRKVKIALAHHADDNAETVLFQMVRGSGIRGLCGIRPKRDFTERAEIIRPLLPVTRSEIETYLTERGQEFRTDSTNLDTDYSRNRIRHEIMPRLLEINRQAAAHMNQSAGILLELTDYLDNQVQKLLPQVCCQTENGWILTEKMFTEQPEILQRELILLVLGKVCGSRKDIGAVHVEAVQQLAGYQVGRQRSLPYGVCARRVYEGILLEREVQAVQESLHTQQEYAVSSEMLLRLEAGEKISYSMEEGEISLRILNFQGKIDEIPKKKYTKWLDYDKIKSGLQIRKRAGGDYLVFDEQGHRKKLKEYFIQEKIPAGERDRMWLVADGAHVIWIIGGRIGADYKIQENTEKILEIQIIGGKYHED